MDSSSCLFPTFEFSKESVRFGKKFRKQFEAIDNTKIKLRLKIKLDKDGAEKDEGISEPCEEFEVNFLQIQYLAKDLNKIEPYSFPLIVFNFQQFGVNNFGQQGSSGFVDRKGMFLTTKAMFEKLEKHGKLPKESSDPGLVMMMNYRYFRLY